MCNDRLQSRTVSRPSGQGNQDNDLLFAFMELTFSHLRKPTGPTVIDDQLRTRCWCQRKGLFINSSFHLARRFARIFVRGHSVRNRYPRINILAYFRPRWRLLIIYIGLLFDTGTLFVLNRRLQLVP